MTAKRRAIVGVIVCAAAVFAGPASAQIYAENFDAPNGAPWPAPWFAVTPHVTVQDVQGGRARLNGDAGHVARMILPGFAQTDVEVTATVEFENVGFQGFGFYVRQNGGYLQDTVPFGQGYAMFLKGNWGWPEDLGLWTEISGVETQFAFGLDPVPGGLQNGTPYRVRFQVFQNSPASTTLRAKVWNAVGTEPPEWMISQANGQPLLQGVAASFAADLYNHAGAGHLFLDDLEIRVLGATGAPHLTGAATAPAIRTRPHPVRAGRPATLELVVPSGGRASVHVYDAAGRLRATPLRGATIGENVGFPWHGLDDRGVPLGAGVYFVRLESDEHVATGRIVVTR